MGKYELLSQDGFKCIDYDGEVLELPSIGVFVNKIIGRGSNGTVVYEGRFRFMKGYYRLAAVKRLSKAQHSVQAEGIRNLISADNHPNIVSVYRIEDDANFDYDKANYIYVAMEHCDCNLDELVKNDWRYAGLLRQNGYPSPDLLELMRDFVVGLKHLHIKRIIHRDLNPFHMLIFEKRGQLSGMGSSRLVAADESSLGPDATGTVGWRSPEQILNLPQTAAMDVFNLGCVFFFILTKGEHPFGDINERESNVTNGNIVNLSLVEHIPEAKDFFSRLLNFEPELRPTASEVLFHPLFWDSVKRMQFLSDASERAELKVSGSVAAALQSNARVAFDGSFDGSIDCAFITQMKKRWSFRYGNVQDLLRIIRTTIRNHFVFQSLPTNIQGLLEPTPEGLDHYFRDRFPNLLMVVYDVMDLHCKEEGWFAMYSMDVEL